MTSNQFSSKQRRGPLYFLLIVGLLLSMLVGSTGPAAAQATFNGQDLTGTDFSCQDLTGVTFNGANLTNVNFNGAILNGATFDGATLTGATFVGATTNGSTTGLGGVDTSGSFDCSGSTATATDVVPTATTGPGSTATDVVPTATTGPGSTATDVVPTATTGPGSTATDVVPTATTGPGSTATDVVPTATTGPGSTATDVVPTATTGPGSTATDVVPTATATVALVSVSVSPSTVAGGTSSTGTVTLTGPAPVGGVTVSLSSSDTAAGVPASVFVPEGQTTATFSITTTPVLTTTDVTIMGTLGNVSKQATLTVIPVLVGTQTATAEATSTSTMIATATATVSATATETGTSKFKILKRFCANDNSDSANANCNGRVQSAEGTTVQFEVRAGSATSGPVLTTVPVLIAKEGNGSQGQSDFVTLPQGTYTVCEIVPAGYVAIPRPGSQGGSNQTGIANPPCITVVLGPNNAVFQFDNFLMVTPTTTPVTPGVTPTTPSGTTGSKPVAGSTTKVNALPKTGQGSARDSSRTGLALFFAAMSSVTLAAGIGWQRRRKI